MPVTEKVILDNVNINEIIPYENNPRKNDGAVEEVINSINDVGYRTPITVDENMVILTGHTRLKALQALGWETIPFIVKFNDMSEKAKKRYRVLDNKSGETALWDYEKLEIEFSTGELQDFGFELTTDNLSDKNKEIDTNDMDEKMKITLNYSESDYWKIKEQLLKIANTPEKAVWELLGNE